jgi:hypothetical protein
MLTEVKNNYKSILKYFDFDESISTAEYNKQKLIEMAKNGEAKPNWKTKLGQKLSNYTSKSSVCYDPIFIKELKKIRSDWIANKSENFYKKKQKLILLAKNGKNKPKERTKLGSAFATYTRKSSLVFDRKLTSILKNIRPDWFIKKSDVIKKELIKIAKSGKHRPNQKTKLGSSLSGLLYNNLKFSKLIKKLRPDWFVTQTQIANQMKQQLLNLAKNGKNKPSQKTKLGTLFSNCKNKKSYSYDPDFINEIKKIRPDWLVRSSFTNRQKLITMAKNGENRPSRRKTKIGALLLNYTSKSCASYDADFDKTIRKLRPDWFDLALLRNNNAH